MDALVQKGDNVTPPDNAQAIPTLGTLAQDDDSLAPSSLLLYYAFNETIGSTQVVDYGSYGFTATAIGRPSFSGSSMQLSSGRRQHLSIDAALGSVIKTLDSFTVTLSIRLPHVRKEEKGSK